MFTSWRYAPGRLAGLAFMGLLGGCASVGAATNPWLADPEVQEGLRVVTARCAGCHATSDATVSPYRAAPPFWSLQIARNPESLQRAAAHVTPGRFAMPSISLTQEEARQVVAYMRAATEADPATRRQLRAPRCIATVC